MTFKFSLPLLSESNIDLEINIGEILFVLGANGSGKSSLMHKFYSSYKDDSKRITAHRQTWFEAGGITITSQQKISYKENIRQTDLQLNSRWREEYSVQRPNITIYEIVDSVNTRARGIADAVDKNNTSLASQLSSIDSPLKIINELFHLSNIPIEISVHNDEQLMASKNGSEKYSIAELSDGERNALLICADVLTAKEGTLFLIDEPERHLYRAIISPLFTLLFEQRPDCSFIISTHDVLLPIDNPVSKILLIRDCEYSLVAVTGWEIDVIESANDIDDTLKKQILGSRKIILFVEGTETSLDKPLYSLIFENVSIIAKSSCRNIEQAVKAIRGEENLHWLSVFGIIDNDGRSQADIENLKQNGIYALNVHSVESIYYHPEIQSMVTDRHSKLTGEDSTLKIESAKKAALKAVKPQVERLSGKISEKIIREEFFKNIPNSNDIFNADPVEISIDIKSIVEIEKKRLYDMIEDENLTEIISLYPIRETSALSEIVKILGFSNRKQYESSVRKLLIDDERALNIVKRLFGSLVQDIT